MNRTRRHCAKENKQVTTDKVCTCTSTYMLMRDYYRAVYRVSTEEDKKVPGVG